MSIQFQCPSCRNPIEIDDEWAGRAVACPFCRNTVTAPESSTFAPPPVIPEARPAVPIADFAAGQAYADVAAGSEPTRNTVAIWALGLSVLWLVLQMLTGVYLRPVFDAVGPEPSTQEMQRYLNDFVTQNERFPPGVVPAMLAFAGAVGCWIAGLVCAIVAVRRPVRRGLAFAAFGVLCARSCFARVREGLGRGEKNNARVGLTSRRVMVFIMVRPVAHFCGASGLLFDK